MPKNRTNERLIDALRTIEASRLTLSEVRAAAVDAAIAHNLDAIEVAQLVDMLEASTGMTIHQSKF